jgi:hypothetical protein
MMTVIDVPGRAPFETITCEPVATAITRRRPLDVLIRSPAGRALHLISDHFAPRRCRHGMKNAVSAKCAWNIDDAAVMMHVEMKSRPACVLRG